MSSEAAARRAKLAQNDRAIISSPAREQHQEVSRLVAALKDESVTSDGSKSAVELAAVADRLESGSYDTQDSLRQALETLLAVE